MATCPFNASHIIPEAEKRFHMSTCPNKSVIETIGRPAAEPWAKGNTDVPTYFPDVALPDNEENWDEEASVARIGVQARDLAGLDYYKNMVG